ncbi:activator of Hsp90 ATPase 1 family protein [Peribacillus muralis]|uniref:Activator of Hsp90 ATPase 1 family protein n=1 Tax=Peribacillus muralis TaxID=264697 RepID=A0A1B3XSQ4_9BACI|nr:SRPBCC family protein [Peribacillus muralis]AOH56235.1 activator of Hsp90 ATPase 1 family protein [Peribacillus muralis]
MQAAIEKEGIGIIARFERRFNHSVEKVWGALTENDKLEKWMSNLEMKDLRKGGNIQFNFNDESGKSFDMKIRDFRERAVLGYEWGDGWVRFELYPDKDGCSLVLTESIPELNQHTSKDLAGWHVCLDMLRAVLAGRAMDFPMDVWERWHEEYIRAVKRMG